MLAITETKKKGQGIINVGNRHILIYSGVEENERARAGVGCIIRKSIEHSIKEWKGVNERLLIVKLENDTGLSINLMVIYGPCEDETKTIKDEFWNVLQLEYEKLEEPVYVVGDFNARVGNRNNGLEETMGKYGEPVKNNNGNRLIDFCIINDLIILNTLFDHKEIHKYTREVKSRNERSLIDYFLTNSTQRIKVNNVRVKRGSEIGSDHFLTVAKIKDTRKTKQTQMIHKKGNQIIRLRIDKLKEMEIRKKYQENVTELIRKTTKPNIDNIEEMWSTFKYIIMEASEQSCGTINNKRNNKQTHWWNEEVKIEIKKKKEKWKKFLSSKKEEDYGDYKKQRKKVKEVIQKAKTESWEEFGNTLEKNFKENQKLFYSTLKNEKKGNQIILKQLQDKQGKILKENNEIMERWREHFKGLLEEKQNNNGNVEEVVKRHNNTRDNREMEGITEEEMKTVLTKLRNGKAPGHDMIKSEQLKYMGEQGEQVLLEMLNSIWKIGKIPKDWEKAVIFPVHKKGDSKNCNNYRGISLLCTTAKIYEAILEKKLRQEMESTMEKGQSGFRKGHSTQDHIFTVRKLIEKTMSQDNKLLITFVDLEKAFDRVPRKQMWQILSKRQTSEQLLNAIKSIYKTTTNYIRTGSERSKDFITTQGLRQGGALSPLLFTIFLDSVVKNIKDKTKRLEIGYHNLTRTTITECIFADDLAIITKDVKDMQYNLNLWNEELQKHNMSINVDKTKIMVIGKTDIKTDLLLNGKEIEQVENFTYLGATINNKGSIENEINKRIQAANRSYYTMNKAILNNKQVSKRTKMTLYKTIYRPSLTYGSETWVMNQRAKSKIQATEMRFLRRVEGVTRLDKIRNEQIRENLQIESIQNTIDKKQLAWYGHLIRMPEERQTKQVWNARITKKKKRGRPMKTWENNIEEILARNNISGQEAKRKAKIRKDWKELISNLN